MPSWAAGLITQKEDLSPALSSHSSSIAGPKEQNPACASPDPRPSSRPPYICIPYTFWHDGKIAARFPASRRRTRAKAKGGGAVYGGSKRHSVVVVVERSVEKRILSTSQWSSPVVGCCSCKSQVSQTRCCCSSSISHWLTFYSPVFFSLALNSVGAAITAKLFIGDVVF
jgi:hypothetical protein